MGFEKLSWKRLLELHLSAWPPDEYCGFAVVFLSSKMFGCSFWWGFFFFFQIKEENREQWKPADSPEVAVGFTVCDAASCSN